MRRSRGVRCPVVLALAAAIAATTAWVADGAPAAAGHTARVVISTRKIPKLGTVLVDSRGLTLYMFVPDKRARVTCMGTCAAVWPPVKLPMGARPVAAGGVKARLVKSDPDPVGGRVVTYDGWPLYTYVGDARPGQATGQALDLNGGCGTCSRRPAR